MAHIGVESLIANMMIHSLSPQGRRLVEQMYTGDPFNIDIKLDSYSTNRSAEIANTYLKTVGRRLVFIKKKKDIKKAIIKSPISFNKPLYKKPISFITDEMKNNGFDVEKDFEKRQKFREKVKNSNAKSPITITGGRIKK